MGGYGLSQATDYEVCGQFLFEFLIHLISLDVTLLKIVPVQLVLVLNN